MFYNCLSTLGPCGPCGPYLSSPGPVKLVLEDGSEAEADLVIDADGSSSQVRRWLVGKEAGTSIPSDWVIGSGIVKYPAEHAKTVLAPSELCAVSIGPDGLALYAIDDVETAGDPVSYSFQVVRIWKADEPGCEGVEAIRKMKAATKPESISEPMYSAVQRIPEESHPVFLRQLQYWPTVPWDNRDGRVTLIGDAAHCILPTRGQGLNHTLNDIDSLLAGMIKFKDGVCTLQETLAAYEAEVFVRGKKVALESVEDSKSVLTQQDFSKGRHAEKGLGK